MPDVLLINPNTRQALTSSLVAQIDAMQLIPGLRLHGATAPFGDDYIASERSYVVAAHAVIDVWHAHLAVHGRPDAVLVACFGDPGVWALREMDHVPVMGLAEAAMREADETGPFGIVTGGAAWGPMLERLARGMRLGGPDHLRAVRTVDASGGLLSAQPEVGLPLLTQACQTLLQEDRDQAPARALGSIIVGGAALAGWAAQMQAACPDVPLVDSVAAGARWLQRVLRP